MTPRVSKDKNKRSESNDESNRRQEEPGLITSEIFFSKAPSIPKGGGDVEESKRELRAKMVITDFEEIRTTFYE